MRRSDHQEEQRDIKSALLGAGDGERVVAVVLLLLLLVVVDVGDSETRDSRCFLRSSASNEDDDAAEAADDRFSSSSDAMAMGMAYCRSWSRMAGLPPHMVNIRSLSSEERQSEEGFDSTLLTSTVPR